MTATSGTRLRRAGGGWVDTAARVGLVARGAVYVVFGLICFGVARGDRSEEASSQGALAELSERSFGNALLVALAVGLGLYALICALGAIRGYGGKQGGESDTTDRVLDAFRAVVNAALAAVAVKIAMDGSQAAGGANQQEQHITARVLDWPGGQLLVGAVGVAIIAAGAWQLKKAVTRDFLENLELGSSSVSNRIEWLGVAGYAVRGVVFALVGWFLLQAAMDHQPDDAVGIDGALKRLVVEPYGPLLLILVALGVIAFGCWSFVEARYRRSSG
jgi:Domain of Unknown Function (DUF1206)